MSKALLITESHQSKLGSPTSVERYTPGPDEVLIKNMSVAQNPVDWKQVAHGFAMPPVSTETPFVNGCDTAGVVESVGSDVSSVKPGDRVISFTPIGKDAKYGTYQTYSIAKAQAVTKIPKSLSFDEAATFPLGYYTASVGLFFNLKIPLPLPKPDPKTKGEAILVWGGASSVGQYVVQLAHFAGMKVVATASERNWAAVKALGADEVVDYKDPEVVSKIKSFAPSLKYVYDAIAEQGTTETALKCLSSSGSVVTVLPFKGTPPEGVTVEGVFAGSIFGDEEKCSKTTELLGHLLESGELKPNPVKLMGGLSKVDEGWELMRQNKVSGQKLVYHPEEE